MQDKIRSNHQILAEVPQTNQQTELLALNAAIEAACPVERGHGFAVVVVDEVRKLAHRTENFDRQIGSLLRDVNRAIEEVYQAVEASIFLDISEADISQNTMKATLASLQNHNELTMQRSRHINGIFEDIHRLVLEGILSAQFEDKVTQIQAILRSQFQLISDSSTDFFKVHRDADVSDSVLRRQQPNELLGGFGPVAAENGLRPFRLAILNRFRYSGAILSSGFPVGSVRKVIPADDNDPPRI